jgi:hypothetical protein
MVYFCGKSLFKSDKGDVLERLAGRVGVLVLALSLDEREGTCFKVGHSSHTAVHGWGGCENTEFNCAQLIS